MSAAKRVRLDPKAGWDWEKRFDMAECCKEFGWGEDDWVVGVDEAGRGPVIGPMTYGGMACRVRDHSTLQGYGVNDSKQLTEERRQALYKEIEANSAFKYKVRHLGAAEISRQQLARVGVSLNKISHEAAISVIHDLQAKINEEQDGSSGDAADASAPKKGKIVALFIDIVGPQATYHRKLSIEFPGITIVVQSKADATFPVTSGASIMAKVERDDAITNMPRHYPSGLAIKGDTGSGYPGDDITKRWMALNTHKLFVLPDVARFDWQPVKALADEQCVGVSWEQHKADVPELFGGAGARKRWQFFQEMFLSQPSTF